MFKRVTPESVGVSSRELLRLLESLHEYRFNPHGIIMAKGNDIFLECYFAPYKADTLHRMYSVSKSFIALAAGIAAEDGLLSLDDKLIKYLPEYDPLDPDPILERVTVRDALSMRTGMVRYANWYGKPDRAKSYFTEKATQLPGASFFYDSAGSFMVGCAVEKLTGKLYMDFLKERVFGKHGFSKDAYCLLAPGGHSHSDSGVMCTPRDLLIFARLLAGGGVLGGERYVSEEFVKEMTSSLTDNNANGGLSVLSGHGYGYLVWKLPRDGYSFVGMANQAMLYDPESDVTMIITSEDMCDTEVARAIYFNELYGHIIPAIERGPIAESPEDYSALCRWSENAKILAMKQGVDTDLARLINGVTYRAVKNPARIETVTVSTDSDKGYIEYLRDGKLRRIDFGMGYNIEGRFPTDKRMSIVASQYVDGDYSCAASAAWVEERKLHIMCHVTDDYEGRLHIELTFDRDNDGNEPSPTACADGVPGAVSVTVTKYAQRILDDYNARFIAYRE